MSETRHYIGKLIKVDNPNNLSTEDLAKEILNVDSFESYYNSFSEKLISDNYNEYFIYNGIIYKIEAKDYEYEDVYIATKNENRFDINVKFYDGGCSLDEAIETALNKLKK